MRANYLIIAIMPRLANIFECFKNIQKDKQLTLKYYYEVVMIEPVLAFIYSVDGAAYNLSSFTLRNSSMASMSPFLIR